MLNSYFWQSHRTHSWGGNVTVTMGGESSPSQLLGGRREVLCSLGIKPSGAVLINVTSRVNKKPIGSFSKFVNILISTTARLLHPTKK